MLYSKISPCGRNDTINDYPGSPTTGISNAVGAVNENFPENYIIPTVCASKSANCCLNFHIFQLNKASILIVGGTGTFA